MEPAERVAPPAGLLVWALLALGLLIRLVHLDAPLVGVHSWRQCDTAAMARNFAEEGLNPLYPRIDWRGDSPGYVEAEFPAYPYAVALLYRVFGTAEALGRLLSALAFLAGAYALFRLVRATDGEATALWALGLILFLPRQIYYTRTFQPEGAMLACSAAGIYFFYRWLKDDRAGWLIGSTALVALAGLMKLPNLSLGLPLLYLAWVRDRGGLFLRPALWLFAAAVLGAALAWSLHAQGLFRATGLTFGLWPQAYGPWQSLGLVFTWEYWNRVLFQFIAERHLTWFLLPLFLLGLLRPRPSPEGRLYDLWLLAFVPALLLLPERNFHHEYWQLPLMLPAVVFPARLLAAHLTRPRLKTWSALLLLAALLGATAATVHATARYLEREDWARYPAAGLVARIAAETRPSELLLVVWEQLNDPGPLYFSHRQGWMEEAGRLTEARLKEIIGRGAAVLAVSPPALAQGPPGLKERIIRRGRVVVDEPEALLVRVRP
jgi:hypothetical protein